MKHNKLVRDRIPEIIAANGQQAVWHVLETADYEQALRQKLLEEVDEFLGSAEVEELADILEVVYTLAAQLNCAPDKLEAIRQQKKAQRGGFESRLFLVETID
ncbi:MAG: nucleoside triphosphate pyrophosphohydrolase [Chloroflexota bacterium]